jgi:ABC-2 type transport system ATP-binding protein
VGDVYCLLGLNGAGKTTTMRMALGMVRPSAGHTSIFGTTVGPSTGTVWSSVGHLVEGPSAYPELTVRENLEVMRRLRRVDDRGAVDRIIESLGLSSHADRRAGHLSSGNAQRLGLAKALIHRPRLLLLDEPVNGLDPAGVVEVRDLLHRLAHDENVTVFMSSHLLAEVAHVATRIGIIHAGRLVDESTMDDLRGRAIRRLVVQTRDGSTASAAVAGLGYRFERSGDDTLTIDDQEAVERPELVATALVHAGAPPIRLQVEEEDLERQFLRLVGAAPAPTAASGVGERST